MSEISFRCTYRYTEMYWSRGEGQLSMADVDCYDFYILKIFSGVTRVIARKRRRRNKLWYGYYICELYRGVIVWRVGCIMFSK